MTLTWLEAYSTKLVKGFVTMLPTLLAFICLFGSMQGRLDGCEDKCKYSDHGSQYVSTILQGYFV